MPKSLFSIAYSRSADQEIFDARHSDVSQASKRVIVTCIQHIFMNRKVTMPSDIFTIYLPQFLYLKL
jgi:hypothetical protein